MYCAQCGESITDPNQNFCHSCGSQVHFVPEEPIPKTTIQPTPSPSSNSQYATAYRQEPKPAYSAPPSYRDKTLVKKDERIYSTACFLLSVASLITVAITFSIGSFYLMRTSYSYYMPSYYTTVPPAVMFVGLTIGHIVGMIFGIIGRVLSSKAGVMETENALEKIGSVLAIFGIILNIVGLGLAVISIGTRIGSMFSPYFPY